MTNPQVVRPEASISSLRRRVHQLLEPSAPGDRAGRTADILIISLITLNIAALVLDTVPSVHRRLSAPLAWFEALSVAVFTVEYVLRVWAATADPRCAGAVRGRLRYAMRPLALIDLLVILPVFLPFIGVDLRAMRGARLLRIIRIGKLGRYSRALQLFARVVRARRDELVATLLLLLLLLVAGASLVYFAEHGAQPKAFGSIPKAMWWAAATITTVGYGDVYPITPLGRFLGALVAVVGMGMFALPTGLLGAAFLEEISRTMQPAAQPCPHCGGPADGIPGPDGGASAADGPRPENARTPPAADEPRGFPARHPMIPPGGGTDVAA